MKRVSNFRGVSLHSMPQKSPSRMYLHSWTHGPWHFQSLQHGIFSLLWPLLLSLCIFMWTLLLPTSYNYIRPTGIIENHLQFCLFVHISLYPPHFPSSIPPPEWNQNDHISLLHLLSKYVLGVYTPSIIVYMASSCASWTSWAMY